MNELRLYTWTLYQLSPIQQGIQAAHATVELAMKTYREQMMLRQGQNWKIYYDWAVNWKTMVCLNGGDLTELRETHDFFTTGSNTLPWASFYEDESLGGCMTSIAMIIPASIFESAERLRKSRSGELSDDYPEFPEWEEKLIYLLARSNKAR